MNLSAAAPNGDVYQQSLKAHLKLRGKLSLSLKDNPNTKEKLSLFYTPGVAAVSRLIAEQPDKLNDYSWTNNLVAVVSDGSAVLGLGDIGPKAAMPVMEGKAMLFKHFAGIDAVPIVLNAHGADQIVDTVKAIAPSFGAINLEDIAAPKCFEIEERLKDQLDIPVFHDDQHGTAVVVLAGLINAAKVVNKDLRRCRVVIVGAGAAGTAVIKLLNVYGVKQMTALDSQGIIGPGRHDLSLEKRALLNLTKPVSRRGGLNQALDGADIFIGVSRPNLLGAEHIKMMNPRAVVFALANPQPEIEPDLAFRAGVAVLATGRSDYPNQVNNALAFPGIFRGALDHGVKRITDDHKLAAAGALAAMVKNPAADRIIPSLFEASLVKTIAAAIK